MQNQGSKEERIAHEALICDVCGIDLASYGDLLGHLEQVHGIKRIEIEFKYRQWFRKPEGG